MLQNIFRWLRCLLTDHDYHIDKVWDEYMHNHIVSLAQCQRCNHQWWMKGAIFQMGGDVRIIRSDDEEALKEV